MSAGADAAVAPGHGRAEAVARRLGELLGGGVSAPRQLSGGASRETWAFELGGPAGARALILQAERLAESEALDRRARPAQAPLLQAAASAGVPVPAVVAAGEDDAVLGSRWVVLEHVEGTADPRAILCDSDELPAAGVLLDQLAGALAAVHRMEFEGDLAPVIADPVSQLREMHEGLGQPHPVFELAFRELEASRPDSTRRTLVHGDFRIGNVLVAAQGVSAVLDWELAHIGDPLEDLGWLCVRAWRFQRPERPAAGLGSREALVAAYERHSGAAVALETLHWWELFGTLRWGVICVVQAFTHLSGAAPSLEHAVIGRRACEVEWDLLELLDPGGVQRRPPGDASVATNAVPALHDRPTAPELLDAARGALGDKLLPELAGRAAFELRVALRALGIVQRELRQAAEHTATHAAALEMLGAADEAELAERVRAGAYDDRPDELRIALRATVRAKLEVANPRHLQPPRS
jgi:aminoglycoside phosphotransferase (APT) family kinase protein